jgi:hypothetical protein
MATKTDQASPLPNATPNLVIVGHPDIYVVRTTTDLIQTILAHTQLGKVVHPHVTGGHNQVQEIDQIGPTHLADLSPTPANNPPHNHQDLGQNPLGGQPKATSREGVLQANQDSQGHIVGIESHYNQGEY